MGHIYITTVVHALKIESTKTLQDLAAEISTILPKSDRFDIRLSEDYDRLFKRSTNIEDLKTYIDYDSSDDLVEPRSIWVGIAYYWDMDAGYTSRSQMPWKEMVQLEQTYMPKKTFCVEARTKVKWSEDYY